MSWMVLSFSASCSWRPLDWRIRHSHLTSTLFHSLVPWWRLLRIRPQITRLSQLENSAMDTWPICKNSYHTRLVRKMAWYKILMMHKTCSINYGHLAVLQKTLPTTDLIKKNFLLIKYLLTYERSAALRFEARLISWRKFIRYHISG